MTTKADAPAAAPDPLDELRQLGELQFTLEEVERIQGRALTKPEREAVAAGQLKGEAAVRLSVYKLALSGSSPAQAAMEKAIQRRRKIERAAGGEP